VQALEQHAETNEREDREDVVENQHGRLYPVTAQQSQLLLHGIVHEMNETAQRKFGAAARAAKNHFSSGSMKRQKALALAACGSVFVHYTSLTVISCRGGFYFRLNRFARRLTPAGRRIITGSSNIEKEII
jgi:hypothetical protein